MSMRQKDAPSSRIIDPASSPYPSQLPNQRSASRHSSTSSIHSIKRKPVPTEFDQLKQLGNEMRGNPSNEDEEVLNVQARPVFLPHSTPSQPSPHAAASDSSSTYPPPAHSTASLSRHASTSSRPLSSLPPLGHPLDPDRLRATARSSASSISSHASRSVFGSPPQGVLGKTAPREVVRIERDYSSGTGVVQFWPGWIWELEGRLSPTTYQTILNDLNLILARAHDPRKAIIYNVLAVLTLWISPMLLTSHYEQQMKDLEKCLQRVNRDHLNPVGLNLLHPDENAFLFLELEYY